MSLPATPEVNEEANSKAAPPKPTPPPMATAVTDITSPSPESAVIQPVIGKIPIIKRKQLI